jgi:hypothetical protein
MEKTEDEKFYDYMKENVRNESWDRGKIRIYVATFFMLIAVCVFKYDPTHSFLLLSVPIGLSISQYLQGKKKNNKKGYCGV